MAIETSQEPRAFSDFEHAGWQTSSAGYDRHWTGLTRLCAGVMVDALGLAPGSRLLDVCTGPGVVAQAASERGASVVGLDFSSALLAIASRHVPTARFQHGDAHDLPFEDQCFDAVACGFGLMHLPRPDVALGEMHRVLRAEGRLGISVWDAVAPDNGLGVLYGAVRAHGNLDVPLPHGPDFFQFSAPESLTAALESTGFKEVTVKRVTPSWEFRQPAELINAIEEGTVRARALLRAQTDAARAAIAAEVEQAAAQFRSDEGIFIVPMPVLVGIASR